MLLGFLDHRVFQGGGALVLVLLRDRDELTQVGNPRSFLSGVSPRFARRFHLTDTGRRPLDIKPSFRQLRGGDGNSDLSHGSIRDYVGSVGLDVGRGGAVVGSEEANRAEGDDLIV